MFCSRTCPRATMRPLSSVTSISQSCWRRPRWIGVDTAVTVPDEIARRKSVLLLTPTTVPRSPLSANQTAPDTLARLSMIVQYTPPCTIPHGCSSLSLISSTARPPSGVTSMYLRPSSLSNPLPRSSMGTDDTRSVYTVKPPPPHRASRYRRRHGEKCEGFGGGSQRCRAAHLGRRCQAEDGGRCPRRRSPRRRRGREERQDCRRRSCSPRDAGVPRRPRHALLRRQLHEGQAGHPVLRVRGPGGAVRAGAQGTGLRRGLQPRRVRRLGGRRGRRGEALKLISGRQQIVGGPRTIGTGPALGVDRGVSAALRTP